MSATSDSERARLEMLADFDQLGVDLETAAEAVGWGPAGSGWEDPGGAYHGDLEADREELAEAYMRLDPGLGDDI